MSNGTLKIDNGVIVGEVYSLQMAPLPLRLESNANKNSPDAPDKIVYAKAAHGRWIEVGSAWERRIERGSSVGQFLYSISIDDPSFSDVMRFTAFPAADGWAVKFERPRKQQPAAQKEAA